MIRSVIFVPDIEAQRWLMVCAQYCAGRRYEIVAVVHHWADAARYLIDGHAAVLVAGQRDHLPPRREPRVEFVTEQDNTTDVSSSRRRPVRRRPPTSSEA